MDDKRACFDFEVTFANGGGLQGQDFRLDIAGEDISDDELARSIVQDLRLLMVASVRILNKRIVQEQHKRSSAVAPPDGDGTVLVDLSHVIEAGMVTYKGLPAPRICDHLSRLASRALYAPGTEFQIGRIDMVGNTGTYMDTPYHRYADGYDLAELPLKRVVNCPGVILRVTGSSERAIGRLVFAATDVRDKAVLVHTGWDRHWRSDCYHEDHPFLSADAATYLRDQGALLVGIDSFNIDDTSIDTRPVHSILLEAGIPIIEHMTGLAALPAHGFRFSAVPPKVRGMGTFPVRAHAVVPAPSYSNRSEPAASIA